MLRLSPRGPNRNSQDGPQLMSQHQKKRSVFTHDVRLRTNIFSSAFFPRAHFQAQSKRAVLIWTDRGRGTHAV